jgi:uncharacterized protein YodC (DUF2158 family)
VLALFGLCRKRLLALLGASEIVVKSGCPRSVVAELSQGLWLARPGRVLALFGLCRKRLLALLGASEIVVKSGCPRSVATGAATGDADGQEILGSS